jgi:hypothetical protein
MGWPTRGDEDASAATRLGHAHDRSHVARILHVDRTHHERGRATADVCSRRRRSADDRDDARRRANRTDRGKYLVVGLDDLDAAVIEIVGEAPFFRVPRRAATPRTATTSKARPARRASATRCAPSSNRRAPDGSAVSASARNVRTIGFCRLVIRRIAAHHPPSTHHYPPTSICLC